jgi:hypothetical protein
MSYLERLRQLQSQVDDAAESKQRTKDVINANAFQMAEAKKNDYLGHLARTFEDVENKLQTGAAASGSLGAIVKHGRKLYDAYQKKKAAKEKEKGNDPEDDKTKLDEYKDPDESGQGAPDDDLKKPPVKETPGEPSNRGKPDRLFQPEDERSRAQMDIDMGQEPEAGGDEQGSKPNPEAGDKPAPKPDESTGDLDTVPPARGGDSEGNLDFDASDLPEPKVVTIGDGSAPASDFDGTAGGVLGPGEVEDFSRVAPDRTPLQRLFDATDGDLTTGPGAVAKPKTRLQLSREGKASELGSGELRTDPGGAGRSGAEMVEGQTGGDSTIARALGPHNPATGAPENKPPVTGSDGKLSTQEAEDINPVNNVNSERHVLTDLEKADPDAALGDGFIDMAKQGAKKIAGKILGDEGAEMAGRVGGMALDAIPVLGDFAMLGQLIAGAFEGSAATEAEEKEAAAREKAAANAEIGTGVVGVGIDPKSVQ